MRCPCSSRLLAFLKLWLCLSSNFIIFLSISGSESWHFVGGPCLASLAARPQLSSPASEASPESALASSWAVSSSLKVARLRHPRIGSHQNNSEPYATDRNQTDRIYTLRNPHEEDHSPQPSLFSSSSRGSKTPTRWAMADMEHDRWRRLQRVSRVS